MKGVPGSTYISDKYTWLYPRSEIDQLIDEYDDELAWNTTIAAVKKQEINLIPEFPMLEEDQFSDFNLQPYPFQKQGISFLTHIGSGIIGDDMGLGKTMQTMGSAHMLLKNGLINKVLVVCPASLKYQWQKELLKFLDYESIVIDGTTTKKKKEALKSFFESDVHFGIANYELIRSMADDFAAGEYDLIIADEAHRLKNRVSATYKAMKKLKSTYRYAATGTPLQNNAEELYALVEWTRPGTFGKVTQFVRDHVVNARKFNRWVPIGYRDLDSIRESVSNMMLRRMKKDVAKFLPPIAYHERNIELNVVQEAVMAKITEDFQALLDELKDAEEQYEINAAGERVRVKHKKEDQVLGFIYMMIACCDHPLLLKQGGNMSRKYHELIPDDITSPKLTDVVNFCKEQVEELNNKKIVIFTMYTKMQAMIVKELEKIGKVAVLNGSMTGKQRQDQIDLFMEDDEYYFFVLSDAGNYGINLGIATTLIHYDSQWNPAIMDQRDGRIHRLNSTYEMANIVNMVTVGTIEEHIQEILKEKRNLNTALVDRTESEREHINSLIALYA
jgi:SNF2 family DNA or RNA helicase